MSWTVYEFWVRCLSSTGCGGVTMGTVCIIWAGWTQSFLFTLHLSLDVVGKLNVWLYTSLLILDIVYFLYSTPIWVRPTLKCQLLFGPPKPFIGWGGIKLRHRPKYRTLAEHFNYSTFPNIICIFIITSDVLTQLNSCNPRN